MVVYYYCPQSPNFLSVSQINCRNHNCSTLEHYTVEKLHTSLQLRHDERDGVSNNRRIDCLLNRLFWRRSKKATKLCDTGPSWGESTGGRWISSQMASNADNVSIKWPHHELSLSGLYPESNGVLDNYMYDADHDAIFSMDELTSYVDSFWWEDGDPIWITATRQVGASCKDMKTVFPSTGIPIIWIRRPSERLIFMTGILLSSRQRCYFETTPY